MSRWTVKSVKPFPFSVAARLPYIYRIFLNELNKDPSPVHYNPELEKWNADAATHRKKKVENVPIPLKFPKEADEGIWGGEGVIQGFIKKKPKRRRFPNFWVPVLKRSVVYSEILNKYMILTVTERTLQLIDKHQGFDNYILETPVQDLKSQLALDIRRQMLLTLLDIERNSNCVLQQRIWEKYKKFKIPKEEAEWFGLSIKEAIKKQKLLEEETMKPQPLKHHFKKVLISQLQDGSTNSGIHENSKSSVSSWLLKTKIFGSKTK